VLGTVLSFISAKGGVGKTVTVASIGSLLADLGKRVMMVDLDANTNGLTLLNLQHVVAGKSPSRAPSGRERPALQGFFTACQSGTPPDPLLLRDNLYIVPASYTMEPALVPTESEIDKTLSLLLEQNRTDFDYIILDNQAGLNICATEAIKVSDINVIVSEYDPVSAEGVERMRYSLRDTLLYNKTWILVNKVLPEFASAVGDSMKIFRYASPIPWDIDVVRAFVARKVALDTENGNLFTAAIMRATTSLLGEDIRHEIAAWTQSRGESFRKSTKERKAQADLRLRAVIEAEEDAERRWFGVSPLTVVKAASYVVTLVAILIEVIFMVRNVKTYIVVSITLYTAVVGMMIPRFVRSVFGRNWKPFGDEAREEMEALQEERQALEEEIAKCTTFLKLEDYAIVEKGLAAAPRPDSK